MRIIKPQNIIAGFYMDHPDPLVPEISFLGEQWATRDYEINTHSHTVWEFYLQLDGWSVWRDAHQNEYECPGGTLFAPPPGLKHKLHSVSSARHHFAFAAINVHMLRIPELSELWSRNKPVHVLDARNTESAFRALIHESTSNRPLRTHKLRLAAVDLVIAVSRLILPFCGTGASDRHPAITTALNAMESCPNEPWHLNDLAHIAGLSPNHFATLFTANLGIPPHRYLLKIKIVSARQLLQETDRDIASIAFELGFSSSQHFSQVFKRLEGLTPSDFRTLSKTTQVIIEP
jgi:AraC-like DNA-binding protein